MTKNDLKTAWIEVIPDDWRMVRASLAVTPVERPPLPEDEVVTCFRDGEVTLRSNRRTDGFTVSFQEIGYQHIEEGDLVIHSMDGGWGAIGVSDSDGKASPVVHAYRSEENDVKFVAYVLRAMAYSGYLIAQTKGIRERSTQFDRKSFSNLYLPLPDLDTQRRIADYLDKEISEMDALIEEFEVLVSTLEKRRVKLVEHTFAINTPESRSGISRVGLLSKMLRRGISPDYSETSGVRVVNQKCVRPAGQVDYGFCRLHDESEKKIAPKLLVQQGDILINSTGTGTLGRSALVSVDPDAPTTFDGHVTIVRPDKTKVDPAYLAWAFYSQEKRLIDFSVGSTNQIELSRATVANLELPYPPLEKQREIADELDREFERMNALIEESTRLIENLKARKTALITEVVTGRKEV